MSLASDRPSFITYQSS